MRSMLSINKGLQALGAIPGLQKKNESIYGIFNVSIQFLEAVRIDTDRTHGNNVLHVSNCSGNTGNSMKMPWLCMLCKMCDVRVCIVLTIMVAIAFIAIIVTILILMN